MTRQGEFVYGVEDTEFQEGSIWAVNPMGLKHGWIAWGDKDHGTDGQMLGERLGPAAQPLFAEDQLPEVKGNWTKCVAIQMRCTNGDDEGTQVLFKTNSGGGRKAYAVLLTAIVAAINSGPEIVALVECLSDSYKHASYGKTFNPELKVTGWTTMDGESAPGQIESDAEETPEVEEDPEPTPAPEKKRRRKAA